jgi:hypothetical protein
MSEVSEWVPDEPEPLPYIHTPLDADLAPDDVAAWAAAQLPGTVALKPLALVNPRRLSSAGRVDALRALERQLSWLHTQQQKLLAVMAEADQSADPLIRWARVGREEVACALKAVRAYRRRPTRTRSGAHRTSGHVRVAGTR